MNSMLSALSSAGLVSSEEVERQNQAEAARLYSKHTSLLPKTLKELASRQDYKFFDRVSWIVELLDKNPGEIDECIAFAEKHMRGGSAGKSFIDQLKELKAGNLTIAAIRAKWPKVFSATT